MKRSRDIPTIFFNASVILAGLASPHGGSAKLLKLSEHKQIRGVISEIVADETIRHVGKLDLDKSTVEKKISVLFDRVYPPPTKTSVKKHAKLAKDEGDTHIFASSAEANAQFLVTLDKKHLLVLQNKIKWVKIVSPKELIERLSKT